jgi:hypothetical protein
MLLLGHGADDSLHNRELTRKIPCGGARYSGHNDMSASWTAYVFGPFYALLPKRWRTGVRYGSEKYVTRAALISGLGEAVLTVIVLAVWFLSYFGMLGQRYAVTADASEGAIIGAEFMGGAGLITFAMHPLTWLILYFAIEGVFRALGALTTGEVVGTLPLYGVDFLWRLAKPKSATTVLPLVPDEINPGGEICDILICSCRKREGWKYPFTLRYGGGYFQVIDEKFINAGPRPYIYSLRRLPGGEVARGLKNYDPRDVLVPEYKLEPLG